jgi:serine protease AprX
MGRSQTFRRLMAIALLTSVLVTPLVVQPPTARATSRNVIAKVSPDLRQLIESGQGATNVKMIVQSTSLASDSLLDSLLALVSGVVVKTLANLNIRILEAPANTVESLADDPNITYISLDAPVISFGHITSTTGAAQVRNQRTGLLGTSTTLDGSNVSIAIVDSGIDSAHKSFAQFGKILFKRDFTGEDRTDDPFGHGTHVAAIAAGEGDATNGVYEGIAPGANLVNLRVLDSKGVGSVSGVLSALDWLLSNRTLYNVRVVNISIGTPALNSYKNDPICVAVRKLVDAGVVVVAAAGNNGLANGSVKVYGAIHVPGNEPSAITVGASNTYGTDSRQEDSISSYSSRGPTRSFTTDTYGIKHFDNLIKPDLVAPGNQIVSAAA